MDAPAPSSGATRCGSPQRAPERERLTITANLLWEDGEPAAVAVAESLATRYPDDPRALMTLSRVQTSDRRLGGRGRNRRTRGGPRFTGDDPRPR